MHILVDARRVKSVVLKYFLGTCLIEENCLVFGACNLLQTALCSVGELTYALSALRDFQHWPNYCGWFGVARQGRSTPFGTEQYDES